MNNTEKISEFWRRFCEENPEVDAAAVFQTWHFGNSSKLANELVELVLLGKKRATASLPFEYDDRPDQMPTVGTYSVVTNIDGKPRCVVRTTEVRIVPFNEVDAEFAFDEGEGDQSRDHWRGVHWDYFGKQCLEFGKEPSETMQVVCERFELLFPKPAN